MDELEKYYQYLKSNGADVPSNYNSFRTTLSDSATANQYYNYLKKNKFDVPDNFDSFRKTFNIGYDSQEVKQQKQPAIPTFMDVAGQTKQTIQTAKQNVPKPVYEQPKPTTGEKVGDIMGKYGITPPMTEQQSVVQYGGKVAESLIKQRDEAIENTIQYRNDKLGIKTDTSSVKYKNDVKKLREQFNEGDFVKAEGKNGKQYVVPGAGFWESAGMALAESFKAPVQAWKINTLEGKDLADYLDRLQREEPFLPEKKPSGVAGAFGETAGGFPKFAAIMSAGNAIAPMMGTGLVGAEAEFVSTAMYTRDLYQRNLQKLLDEGVPVEEARLQAADKAKKDAPVIAMPDAAMAVGLGVNLNPTRQVAAETFKKLLVKEAAHATKIGLAGGGAELAKAGTEVAMGYDVTPNEALERFADATFEWATMDAMFKVLPLMRKMPGALKASYKEYLRTIPREVIEQQAAEKNVPIEEIDAELNSYEAARSKVADIVPEESVSTFAGLTEKQDKLKSEISELESKKAVTPEGLHPQIEKEIEVRKSEIESINKQIADIAEKGDAEKIDIDRRTGEPELATVIMPEEISQPIELEVKTPQAEKVIPVNEQQLTTSTSQTNSDNLKQFNIRGREIGIDKPIRQDFQEGEKGDNEYAEANIKHNKRVDDLILSIKEEGVLIDNQGNEYDVEITSQGVRVSPKTNNGYKIYTKGKRVSGETPFTHGFTFKPKNQKIQPTPQVETAQIIEPTSSQKSQIEYKRLVEPQKPISEMNSEELYELAIANRKELKKQDFEFKDKTEKEKEESGYYNVIDDVEDLRDTSERINFIENAENVNDLASSTESALRKFNKDNPSEYSLAILNAIRKKAIELNIKTEDLIKAVVKKIGNKYQDVDDAETMIRSYLEKIAISSQTDKIQNQLSQQPTPQVETAIPVSEQKEITPQPQVVAEETITPNEQEITVSKEPLPTEQQTTVSESESKKNLTEYEINGSEILQKQGTDGLSDWLANQPLLGGFNGLKDIANKAGIKFPQTQKEFDAEVKKVGGIDIYMRQLKFSDFYNYFIGISDYNPRSYYEKKNADIDNQISEIKGWKNIPEKKVDYVAKQTGYKKVTESNKTKIGNRDYSDKVGKYYFSTGASINFKTAKELVSDFVDKKILELQKSKKSEQFIKSEESKIEKIKSKIPAKPEIKESAISESEATPITETPKVESKEVTTQQPDITVTEPTTTQPIVEEVKSDLGTKARDLAAKVRSGERQVLPDWLQASLPKGTKKQGIDINEAFAKALETFADIYDTTKDFAQAVEQGFKNIKDWFEENKIPYNEAELKAQFAKDRQAATEETQTPPTPPIPPVSEGEGGKVVYKMRLLQKNLINRSTALTAEQKALVKTNPEAMYEVLPMATSKKIALETIKELGVEEAVREASLESTTMTPVERAMVLGAAMDYYAGEAQKAKSISAEKRNADLEIEANEKFDKVVEKLGKLGTAYGQAINIFKSIYKLSHIALARKIEQRTQRLKELNAPEADKQVEEVITIINNEQEQVKNIGKEMTDEMAKREASLKEEIAALQKEIADLKKQIQEDTGKPKGSKENPLKIKRKTDDTEYDRRLKEFRQRNRTGLNKDDLSDLTYFGMYHLENGLVKFADWYNAMAKKFGKFKEHLPDIYDRVKEDALNRGEDAKVFSDANEVQEHLNELQAESDAKKMAQITKRQAVAEFNKAMQNNPDKARIIAPRIAAKRIRQDAANSLDNPTTKNEQTYLKKLVSVVVNKAKEYYADKKEKIDNVNDWLQFAIANGKKDYKIWENTQEEVKRQIDADERLNDTEKAEVKDFLDEYINSVFETLLTETQQRKIINQKLIDNGFGAQRTIKGKIVNVVDWEKVIGSPKNKAEAKSAIVKAIKDLGFTEAEAKNEINALLDMLDGIIVDKITAQTNKVLNKGLLTKAKSLVTGGVGRTKIQKLVGLKDKGILDAKGVREALSEQLGIHELSEKDYNKIKELLAKLNTPNLPVFVKKKIEEEVQYLFDKYGGNMGYLKHREFGLANQLGSIATFIQNLSGLNRVPSKILVTAIKTGNLRPVLSIAGKEIKKAFQVAKTVAFTGDVSRGTAFDDFIMSLDGNPKVRYTEYGENKLLGMPDVYVDIAGKPRNVNLFNQGMTATSRVVSRGMEAADTFASNPIAALDIYENIIRELKVLHPEYSSKKRSQMAYDLMYGEDIAAAKAEALKAMQEIGMQPTEAQLNRAAYEAVERKINEKFAKNFYEVLESKKPDAKKRLEDRGIQSPTEEQITEEAYLILGRDEPMDIIASGEREAQRLTGKQTPIGITWAVLAPIEYMQRGLRRNVTKEHGLAGKITYNSIDAATQVVMPFISSIGRWIEFGIELTPYGTAKGIVYKLASKPFGRIMNIPASEVQKMGTDFIYRGIQGTAQTMLGFWLLALLDEEDKEPEELVTGTYQEENYNKEKVERAGKPKRTINLNGHNIPIDLLGSSGIPYMMWSDFLKRRKSPDYDEKHDLLYMSVAVYMDQITQSYANIDQRYGGLLTSIQQGKSDKAGQSIGTIVGQTAGKYMIPFNRTQADIAQLWNPESKQSIDFGTNALMQLSIVRGFDIGKPNFDYRGRIMDVGDMYAMSVDGMRKMFEKNEKSDGIDEFLAKIDFAATDAYRESKNEENYKYTIIRENGKRNHMTPEEYYDFKFETAKIFDDLLIKNTDKIKEVKIDDPIVKKESQRRIMSKMLTEAKEQSLEKLQKSMPYKVSTKQIEKKEEKEKDLIDKEIEKLKLEGFRKK